MLNNRAEKGKLMSPLARIARRTRGQSHGPITRLMSPSDFARLLKPFVFLDLFDTQPKPFTRLGLHPHSGIATLTYVAEGSVRYEDTNGATGVLPAGGLEWMRAGGGVWHGGGAGESGRAASSSGSPCRPSSRWDHRRASIWDRGVFPTMGRRVSSLAATEPRQVRSKPPSPMNYLAVRLKAGERWSYQPPTGHTVLWIAVGMGSVLVPDELQQGELVAFRPSSAAIEFEAQFEAEFVLGSAVPHDRDLILGSHSVHTSTEALREAEARISAIQTRLIQQGRL